MKTELITKESVDALLAGGKSIATVVGGVTNDLVNEALNLFIFESVMGILKFASVFVIFFIVKKYLDTMIESSEKESDKKVAKAFKVSALVISIVFFTTKSFPHIEQIGKAIYAPKIFLLEKANVLKKLRGE